MARDWHPEDIKAAVRKRGMTMAALSRAHGLEANSLRKVTRQPWPACERIVAAFLGVPPDQIWPSRYIDGRPRVERRCWKRKDITEASSAHVRKREAA